MIRYDSKFISKELRHLANLVDDYDDGLEWRNLIRMIDLAKVDLASKQKKSIKEEPGTYAPGATKAVYCED